VPQIGGPGVTRTPGTQF